MATAWRVVSDDYTSPYIGRVKGPRYSHPPAPILMPVGAVVEHDSSDLHPHRHGKRGIWAWREEHFQAALAMHHEIAGSRILELHYDDPADVAMPRYTETIGSAMILHRCRVARELDQLDQFIELARGHATNRGSRIHGVDHWRRVGETGAALAAETPGADSTVAAAFAALHDSQRRNDGRDREHGARAAELARQLVADRLLRFNAAQLETLCAALVDHDRGLVSDDPTIGVSWDSDRLDLIRLGIRPRPELLSTDGAKERASSDTSETMPDRFTASTHAR